MSRVRIYFGISGGNRYHGGGAMRGLEACHSAYSRHKELDLTAVKKLPKLERLKVLFENLAVQGKYMLITREPRNVRFKKSRYQTFLRKQGMKRTAPRPPVAQPAFHQTFRFGVQNATTNTVQVSVGVTSAAG